MRQRYRAVRHLAGPAGTRILVSRSEASVEERPWTRQDSRNVTGRRWRVYGAGRVRCVAARGVPARSDVPRHGLRPRRFSCLASGTCRARADGRAREHRRGRAGGRRSCVGTCHPCLARRWARRVCAHPVHRGRVPAFTRDRHDGPVASACGVVVGMLAVLGLLPEYRPAPGGNSSGADSAVGAATGHTRDRGLAANGMGPGAPGPGGRPCRGGRRGDRPPIGSSRLPGAVHRGAHAPGAGRAHEGAWRVWLSRARSLSCWSVCSC
jgi:hypothetical protein